MCDCAAISCGDPGRPAYSLVASQDFHYPGEIRFLCKQGYSLVGASILTCQSNGSWTTELPSCVPISCPAIENSAWILRDSSNFTYGSVVSFQCPGGFRILGSTVLKCHWHGHWDSTVPKCLPKQCSNVTIPDNSRLLSANNSYLGHAQFECVSGYEATTALPRKVCTANATWTDFTMELCQRELKLVLGLYTCIAQTVLSI